MSKIHEITKSIKEDLLSLNTTDWLMFSKKELIELVESGKERLVINIEGYDEVEEVDVAKFFELICVFNNGGAIYRVQ